MTGTGEGKVANVRSGAETSEGDVLSAESIAPDLEKRGDQRAPDGDPMPDGTASSDRARSTDAPDGSDVPDELSDSSSAPRPVTQLPDAVRLKIIGWAAEVLSSARPIDIPTSLARVARFAPTKRARLAGAFGRREPSDPGQ